MSALTVREWTAEDVGEIAEIESVCFSDPWSEDVLRSSFGNPLYKSVLIEENGRILAYALESVLFEVAEVAIVAVAPEMRRRGFGRRLMEALIDEAAKRGAQKLFLEVRVSNFAAQRLYEDVGFSVLNVRKRYYADGEDALVMTKEL